jgi:hypothetical protein
MNKHLQLPKGHTTILSPAFKYVPAARTDVAETFARIRGRRLHEQPAPAADGERRRAANDVLNIEVLEASWIVR